MGSESESTSNVVIEDETVFAHESAGQILAHWNTLRGDRMAPRRNEVDPIDLFDFLPNVAMIRPVNGGEDFQFSLIGTGLAKIYGLATRQLLSTVQCWPPTREALAAGLKLCMTAKASVHGEWGRAKTLKQRDVDLEVVLMPISEDGAEVSRILCYHAITP